jgi:hypothetical protein
LFVGKRRSPVAPLYLYPLDCQGYHPLSTGTPLCNFRGEVCYLKDTSTTANAESELGGIVGNQQGGLSRFKDIADGFEGSIACVIWQEDDTTGRTSIRRQAHQKAWCTSSMVDSTLIFLIDGTEITEHLFAKKGAYLLRQE